MFLEPSVPSKKDNKQIIYRGLCWEGMGKVGKTFTLDLKVLAWLEDYSKKEKMKESAMVNSILNSVKRRSETWQCSECGGTNVNGSTVCYADPDCEGVKA